MEVIEYTVKIHSPFISAFRSFSYKIYYSTTEFINFIYTLTLPFYFLAPNNILLLNNHFLYYIFF